MGLLRTLIFLVGTYYIIRFILRYIVPAFQSKPSGPARSASTEKKKNAVVRPGNMADKAGGEYVDYEEIK